MWIKQESPWIKKRNNLQTKKKSKSLERAFLRLCVLVKTVIRDLQELLPSSRLVILIFIA